MAEALAERRVLADVIDGTDIFVQVADRDFNWLAINKSAATNSRAFLASDARKPATTCWRC